MNENDEAAQVTCQMCGASFGSEQELNAHNKKEHGMDTGDTGEGDE